MCFSTPEMKEPAMPMPTEPEDGKSQAYTQNKRRKGYQSTILAGDLQAQAPVEKKRLLGE